MAGRRLGWLLSLGLLGGAGLYFGSALALGLAAALVAVPLFSLEAGLILRPRVRVTVTGGGSLHKGDWGEVTLRLENPTALPVMLAGCRLISENCLNGQRTAAFVTLGAGPRGSCGRTLRFQARRCGRIRFRVEKLRLYDCFGLLGVKVPCESLGWATVQPDTFPMAVEVVEDTDQTQESEAYAPDRPGNDPAEVWQLRDYVPGDSPRRVHWKLSGKFDRLIVRDPALPITRKVLLFWERTGDGVDPAATDAQAEVLITLCRSLLEGGIGFCLAWNDVAEGRCVSREIRDLDEFVAAIPRLLTAAGAARGVSGAELLLQTRPELLCGHMVYLAREPQPGVLELCGRGRTTLLLCGNTPLEGAKCFDSGSYRRTLAKLEI